MPLSVSGENNFTKGLITEATGLNFPENAATSCDNVHFGEHGDVTRRLGIDFEENYATTVIDRTNRAVNSYRWRNAGGDGTTELLVLQTGNLISFFSINDATVASPISDNKLVGTVDLTAYVAAGGSLDFEVEADFADGNGYLFVYHASCDPLYCTLLPGGDVAASAINVKIRDFGGIPEIDVPVDLRPTTLTDSHAYNLGNQGWTTSAAWDTEVSTVLTVGSHTYNVGTVAGINLGDNVTFYSNAVYYGGAGEGTPIYGSGYVTGSGTVTAYTDPNLTINVTNVNDPSGGSAFTFLVREANQGFVDAWNTSQGNYPSNADVWWYFKNSSGVFDPTTQVDKTLATGNAPQGHYLVNAFNIDRSSVSGVADLTAVATTARPSTGAWFQGRVWYTGVNGSQQAVAEEPFYTWSENIYFSQVNVGTAANFGNCFQTNDPTSEIFSDILPTDGGVIQIQGSGRVYKLFPIQNGMIVFASNGVWFITGSQGIGFAANDYTITKLSNITSISSSSFVNVQGLPYFWNEDGIYAVEPQQGGGLAVNTLTYSTIGSFYEEISPENKRYVKGAYHPSQYTIQWIYRDAEATTVTERYSFDSMLNYNVNSKAFYPYSIEASVNDHSINGIVFIQDLGDSDSIPSGFKYIASSLNGASFDITLADEHDEDYLDWTDVDYESFFVTGYKIKGQAMMKSDIPYVVLYNRNNGVANSYRIQAIFDYASNGNSGRWSSEQVVNIAVNNYDVTQKRLKLRGRGRALQLRLSSQTGMPFDIIGWGVLDYINSGA